MKKVILITLFSFYILQTASASDAIATVNGKPISNKIYEAYLKYKQAKTPGFDPVKDKQVVIDELVSRELMYQDALKRKLDKNPEITYQIEQQRINLLIKHAIREATKDNPITEAEMKKEYEAQIKNADLKEFKASHVLLKTEKEAEKIVSELDKGKKIADLAKAFSTGPTGKNGGDLGWFSTSQMVPEFAQTVSEMKKGTYTKTPVQTKFGWHVIYLEDARKREAPTYDSVKRQIALILQNKRVKEYSDKLKAKAKIEITK